MTAAVEVLEGVFDIPEDLYHADPVPCGSLSSTGARKLLPPSCPAVFRWWADHPEPPKEEFDIGTAAHQLVLGTGPELVVVKRDRWDTIEVKAEVKAIRERGAVPLKRAQHAAVQAMADAVRQHPLGNALFTGGRAEQTLIWRDDPTGVMRRARVDYLRRDYVIDLKTCQSAHPSAIAKSVANYGYHQQAAWYLDGVRHLGLAQQPRFLFVFVEKHPPHLVTVAQPDSEALDVGAALNQRALEVYRDCTAAGVWPAYSSDVELVGLPRWAARDITTWEYQ